MIELAPAPEPLVTKPHLLGFGAIIHYYATVETGIKIGLAFVLGIDLVDMMILTEPYSNASLRNISKAISKVRDPITVEVQNFIQIVGHFGTFTTIRNHIAHSSWTTGARDGAIRPRYLAVRKGKAQPYGSSAEEPDWTIDELYAEADKLVELNKRIVQFLIDVKAVSIILD